MGTTEAFALFLSELPGNVRIGSTASASTGSEVRLVDENGIDVPRGEVGDMIVKGETFALFYLHQYHKTQNSFPRRVAVHR